ncbi:MAG: RNA-binding protein [Bauldia sp.]|nr:RNA-binding protein [Bauldia sp.]
MPRRNEPLRRTCIVTRASLPVGELIRFVLDPEGRVVPDMRHRLPGRGVWVTASAAAVDEAERKKLFARGFKEAAIVEPGLSGRVAEQLRAAALAALSLSRKAGELVLGFAKVEDAIRTGQATALIHASDAAADGVRKLDALFARLAGHDRPSIRAFGAEEMGLALGRSHVIHAALLAGRASAFALDQIALFARFHDREPRRDADFRSLTTTAAAAAGHNDA